MVVVAVMSHTLFARFFRFCRFSGRKISLGTEYYILWFLCLDRKYIHSLYFFIAYNYYLLIQYINFLLKCGIFVQRHKCHVPRYPQDIVATACHRFLTHPLAGEFTLAAPQAQTRWKS